MIHFKVMLSGSWQSSGILTYIRGRVKSKRGGPGDISVKLIVDWPQNLTAVRKPGPPMIT